MAVNRTGGPPRRPLPGGDAFFTPGASGLRQSIERRVAAPVLFLYQMPRWIVPAALLLVLVAGFALPGWAGAAALLVLTAVLGGFAYLSWPNLTARGRVLRGAAIVVMILLAVAQATR